jgi:hypothetical protein
MCFWPILAASARWWPQRHSLTVLREQDQRGGVRRLQRQHQRQKQKVLLRGVELHLHGRQGVPSHQEATNAVSQTMNFAVL